jgi:hypothetical protein
MTTAKAIHDCLYVCPACADSFPATLRASYESASLSVGGLGETIGATRQACDACRDHIGSVKTELMILCDHQECHEVERNAAASEARDDATARLIARIDCIRAIESDIELKVVLRVALHADDLKRARSAYESQLEALGDIGPGEFFRDQRIKCDGCGAPIQSDDHATDEDVCGSGDGPGFFLCGSAACGDRYCHMGAEERRAYFTKQRAANAKP